MSFHLELSRRTFVVLIVLIGGMLVGIPILLYLPKAQIYVTPATENRAITQEISLSTKATAPDFVNFTLPANVVEKEIEDSQTITRDAANAHEDYAKGTVTLINEQNDEQPLLPKTHLRFEATGVQFLTDKAVRIPPQGQIQVTVTAEQKGESGNVPAGKFIIDKLPASAQSVIYATSSDAFTGGVVTDSAITEDEINKAKDDLKKKLTDEAAGQLTAQAGGAAIPPELVNMETEEDSASVEPGSFATSFTVRAKVHAQAFVVSQNDLLSLTLIALRKSTTSEEEFVKYDPESFKPKILQADFSRGTARLQGSLTGTFAKKIEPSILSPDNLAGLGKQETIDHFTQFPSVGSAEVRFSPFWVTSVPSRKSAIEISIKNS